MIGASYMLMMAQVFARIKLTVSATGERTLSSTSSLRRTTSAVASPVAHGL
jgi:hypothetical protein